MIRDIAIATISAITIWYGHEVAHDYYGTSPEALGDVGLALAAVTGLGVLINILAATRGGDVERDSAALLLVVSVVTAYGLHDVLHRYLGASAEAITTISVILAAVTFVGTILNRGGYRR